MEINRNLFCKVNSELDNDVYGKICCSFSYPDLMLWKFKHFNREGYYVDKLGGNTW